MIENKGLEQIKIHVVGMDERSCNTLNFFFQKFCKKRCEMSEEYSAQAFLINLDGVGAALELARLKKSYPALPLILTSVKPIPPEFKEYYFLRKPMIAKQLVTIIDQITGISSTLITQNKFENLDKSAKDEEKQFTPVHSTKNRVSGNMTGDKNMTVFVGDLLDIDLRLATKKENNFFDLERHFLGYMQQAYHQAITENRVVKISGLWNPIFIFPMRQQIYIEMSDRQLRSICAIPVDASILDKAEINIEPIEESKALGFCDNNQNYRPLDLFMWTISLWTSRGRLPRSIPLDSPLYLLGWPNFTRLILTPEALRICAYWVPHPRTVINIAEISSVPQCYLFALMTACHTLGMTGEAHRSSDVLILPSDVEVTAKVNLFSRIIKRLTVKET